MQLEGKVPIKITRQMKIIEYLEEAINHVSSCYQIETSAHGLSCLLRIS